MNKSKVRALAVVIYRDALKGKDLALMADQDGDPFGDMAKAALFAAVDGISAIEDTLPLYDELFDGDLFKKYSEDSALIDVEYADG